MSEYGENNGVISSDSDGRGQVDMVTVCPLGQEMRSVIDRMTFKNAVQIKGPDSISLRKLYCPDKGPFITFIQ